MPERPGAGLHDLPHAEKFYGNAGRDIPSEPWERDVIRNHMWPVTLGVYQGQKGG